MTDTNPGGAFMEMEFPAEVWLAAETVPLGRLVELRPGEVLSLSKDPDDPVDLVVNGVTVASGVLVVVDGTFGLRVTATATQELAEMDRSES